MIGDYWTKVKLERIESFLPFFIDSNYKRYVTMYIDPFGGNGEVGLRSLLISRKRQGFFALPDPFINGSAKRALEIERTFSKYYFSDINETNCQNLRSFRDDFPDIADKIHVECGDANEIVLKICYKTDWQSSRAVFFLDPPGMQVDWRTIEAIAKTKAADMWYLFPLAQAVNRLLKCNGRIAASSREALTRLFGDPNWENEFYRPPKLRGFFPELNDRVVKCASLKTITDYLVRRLETVFPFVVDKPLPLYNRRNSPLFLLCYASSDANAHDRLSIAREIAGIPSTAMQFTVRLKERLSIKHIRFVGRCR
jgi:three-Cys-motif partner protein